MHTVHLLQMTHWERANAGEDHWREYHAFRATLLEPEVLKWLVQRSPPFREWHALQQEFTDLGGSFFLFEFTSPARMNWVTDNL